MSRIREILARRYWRLTGWQWLLVAVVVGAVLYLYWRRRVEEEEAFTEGVEGEEDRGGASELALPFDQVDYVEIPSSEFDEGFDSPGGSLLEEILITLEGIADTIAPTETPAGSLPPWRERIRELRNRSKERREQAARQIGELRAGGVTGRERQRIRRLRERQREQQHRTRERIQGIRQRHAGTAPTESAPAPAARASRRDAPLVHAQSGARVTRPTPSSARTSRVSIAPRATVRTARPAGRGGSGGGRRGRR